MNEEKIKEVFSDEEFVKSLLALETPEEVQAALADKDVNLSVEEIKTAAQLLQKKANGELSDEELENVAGGSVLFAALVGIVGVSPIAAGITACVIELSDSRW